MEQSKANRYLGDVRTGKSVHEESSGISVSKK